VSMASFEPIKRPVPRVAFEWKGYLGRSCIALLTRAARRLLPHR